MIIKRMYKEKNECMEIVIEENGKLEIKEGYMKIFIIEGRDREKIGKNVLLFS